MRKTFLLLLLFSANFLFAQNYEITFNGAGESSIVDSVNVHNINLNTSLTLPGTSILHLIGPTTHIVSPLSSQGSLKVYPNPMNESATIEFIIAENSDVQIDIVDLQGKIIVRDEKYLTKGEYSFEIGGLSAGMYSIVVATNVGRNTAKLVSTADALNNPRLNLISHSEIEDESLVVIKNSVQGGSKNTVEMEYVDGNVLIFTAYSGSFATVSSQIPTQSQNLTQNFVSCVDQDDYSYSIIEFGDQIWMAENLRFDNGCTDVEWIDSLDAGWCGYYLDDDTNLDEYGMLYQWSASRIVCPFGWKLPSDNDWSILEMYLGMPYLEAYGQGLRGTNEGAKISGTELWQIGPLVEDPYFGSTGFDAKPAGMRHFSGSYNFIGMSESFWSSTEYSSTQAWYRTFSYGNPKIARYYYSGKSLALSVRCIKDTVELTDYPIIETLDVSQISQNSALVTGKVINHGLSFVVQRGFVWSTSHDASLINNQGFAFCGIGLGEFSANMAGLAAGTVYYVRAFATNDAGTVYGNELSFESSPELLLPVVVTEEISELTNFAAKSGGNVISDGGAPVTSRGVVWGIEPNPTTTNNFGITINQNGLGEFVSELELIPSTTFYVRAYATNSVGTEYGDELTFVTPANTNCGFVEFHDYSYSTIMIGNQCWLAENLKYLPQVMAPTNLSDTTPCYYVYQYTGNNVIEAKSNINYATYGVLYNWTAAIEACPPGWHLPCEEEWQTLELTIGMSDEEVENDGYRGENCGSKLAGEANLWTNGQLDNNQFFDITEFRALPGGNILTWFSFNGIGGVGCWWSDTESGAYAKYRSLSNLSNQIYKNQNPKKSTYSIRCVKDLGSDLAIVTTSMVQNITQLTASCGGNVENNGGSTIIAKGLVWGTANEPTLIINDGFTIDGHCTGTFQSNLSELLPNTTYFVRAYVTNSNGTAYGNELSFETLELMLPEVITTEVSAISQNSAIAGGEALNDFGSNIIAKGLVWGTTPNPSLETNTGFTVDGDGLGMFTSNMAGLEHSTIYYVRAYATNSVGTSYGEQLVFETLPLMLPQVATAEVEYITHNSALSGGLIIDDGGSFVSSRGIVWGQSQNPTIESYEGISYNGIGTGSFINDIEPLESLHAYYVRAFATNEVGTSYGEQYSFETMSMGEDGLPCPGMDSVYYEGYYYATIKFGNYCWFAEDLRFLPSVGSYNNNDTLPYYSVPGYWGTSVDDAMLTSQYLSFGALYNFAAASISCPGAWALPSDSVWKNLEMILGMTQLQANLIGLRGTYEGSKLAGNAEIWADGLLDADMRFGQSGFNCLPGYAPYNQGMWWSSTVDTVETDKAYYRKIYNTSTRTERDKGQKSINASVRCVKELYTPNAPVVSSIEASEITDSSAISGGFVSYDGGADIIARGVVWGTSSYPTIEVNDGFTVDGIGIADFVSQMSGLLPGTIYYYRAYATNSAGTSYGEVLCLGTIAPNPPQNPCLGYESVDYQGYTYQTVKIGTQCWLAENLRYLPSFTVNPGLYAQTYRVYGYNGSSIEEAKATINYEEYGVLYNFKAALNYNSSTFVSNGINQGVCPDGWHIPTNNEMVTLRDFLGGSSNAGGKLKEISTEHWLCPNISATNESLFGGLPAGQVYSEVSQQIGEMGMWWSTNYYSAGNTAVTLKLSYDTGDAVFQSISEYTHASVRCVKDLELANVVTLLPSYISQTVVSLDGEVVHDGVNNVTERGIIWNLTDNLSMENYDGRATNGTGIGSFSCEFTNFNYGSNYYYRAYAINSVGVSYGEIMSFQTNPQADFAVVITSSVDNITSISADFSGELIDDGGEPETIKGFVWSTNANPTIESNEGIYYDVAGEGEFLYFYNLLHCSTTYYLKSFAINTAGVAYGNEITFVTEDVSSCGPVFYQGYTYNTVQIGCQCWFAENLRYLPSVNPYQLSYSGLNPAYIVRGNTTYDVDYAKSLDYYQTYGVLYNHMAATTACPPGWNLPSEFDWNKLELFLGVPEENLEDSNIGTNQGSMLAGTDSLWSSSALKNDPDFDLTGFNAIPAGYYSLQSHNVINFGLDAVFWSSGEYSTNDYYYRRLETTKTTIYRNHDASNAYSVRCVKDNNIEDSLPLVTTDGISAITANSATCIASVLDSNSEEPFERGFVWSTSTEPSITYNEGVLTCGNGVGEFNGNLSGLAFGNTYYVRAYATNNTGTSYGQELSFVANNDALPPDISTVQVTEIGPISAKIDCIVNSEGGSSVTERGVVWSKIPHPDINENQGKIQNGTGIGSYNCIIGVLEDSTHYYVRAYAINENGTVYGEELSFETIEFPNCGDYDYQGHIYKTVIIGEQCWLAENLRYLPTLHATSSTSSTAARYYISGVTSIYGISDYNTVPNYVNYGAMYNWIAAQTVCPVGWDLPTNDQWNELELELGMPIEHADLTGYRGINTGSKLAGRESIWMQDSLTNDEEFGISGFKAVPGTSIHQYVDFWSSNVSSTNISNVICRRIRRITPRTYRFDLAKSGAAYVRCVRDTTVELSLSSILSISSSEITQTTVHVGGDLVDSGVPVAHEIGIIWDTTPNPTINNYIGIVDVPVAVGIFDYQLNNLQPATQYFYRAYAKNMIGIVYGDVYTFTTPIAATLPIITTDSITNIAQSLVTGYATLIDNGGELGIVTTGFVLNSMPNPDLNNFEFKTESDLGLANITEFLFGLNEQTTYYVRAYAVNSTGISYGDEISFTTSAYPRCGTIGYHGYNYKTILIGEQCWMGENMKYLPSITPQASWSSTTIPKYAVYEYTGTAIDVAQQTENYMNYGALYNWPAANTICPIGWHLPSDDELKELELELGMSQSQADTLDYRGETQGSMIASQSQLWVIGSNYILDKNPDYAKTGFDLLPGGSRSGSGSFSGKTISAAIWSSTNVAGMPTRSYNRSINRSKSGIARSIYIDNSNGLSVRCLMDDGFTGSAPIVETHHVSNLEVTPLCVVNVGGDVTYDGCLPIISRGVVWSTFENPTLGNCLGFTNDGVEIGEFESIISGLTPDVQYYYRAYVTNTIDTAYGEQLSFITSDIIDGFPCPTIPYFVDARDANVYNTVSLGGRCWMSENLKYLPEVYASSSESSTLARYYVYDNESTVLETALSNVNYSTYGVLYNFVAANSACPDGWQLPSTQEWKSLEIALGMTIQQADSTSWRGTNEGSKLASNNLLWTTGQLTQNAAFSSSGFNAIPAGCENGSNSFASKQTSGFFWTSTISSSLYSYRRQITYNNSEISNSTGHNETGISVRCIKNEP